MMMLIARGLQSFLPDAPLSPKGKNKEKISSGSGKKREKTVWESNRVCKRKEARR